MAMAKTTEGQTMKMGDENQRFDGRPVLASVNSSLLLVCACLLLVLSGCGFIGKKVNAYERAVLSKPGMALVEHPKEQAGMNHMFNAREGSMGGFGGAGGGCGCN